MIGLNLATIKERREEHTRTEKCVGLPVMAFMYLELNAMVHIG